MTIYNAYLVKGYLSDKKAPKRIMEALDNLIGHLHAMEGKQRPPIPAPEPVESEPDSSDEDDEPARPSYSDPSTDRRVQPQETASQTPSSSSITVEHSEPPPPEAAASDAPAKKQRNFSPEARAAAAERMRAMQARKRAEREGKGTQEATAPSEPEPLPPARPAKPVTVDTDRLLTVHNGYAGKRDDGTLTESDWPDIKARLAKSPDRRAIASDYDVDIDDLNAFITMHQGREARSSGEAQASPFSVGGGAARPRW